MTILRHIPGLRNSYGNTRRSKSYAPSGNPAEVLEVRTLLSASLSPGASRRMFHDAADPEPVRVARIVNGTRTTDYPSVGEVGTVSDFDCTGTLIAPQYVLTAAHCAEGVGQTGGRFRVGGQVYRTTRIFIHPNYRPQRLGEDSANDIAIYQLDRPVTGVTPSPLYRSAPTRGQMLTLVGYGYGGTGTRGHDGVYGIKRVGNTPIDTVTPKLIKWRFDNNSESNTAPGDSGGPLFLNVGGVNYIAGVTSGGERDNSGIGDRSFNTRVDAYLTWIESIITAAETTTTVSIRATDAVAAETLPGRPPNPGSFVVSRTGTTTSPLVVRLNVTGTASNGIDYARIPATITIPAGASTRSISVDVIDDSVVEPTETVIVSLSAASHYRVSSSAGSARVTIADNDVQKSNDMFAGRRQIRGNAVQVSGSNAGATREPGEPNIAGVSGGKSVWWTWTASVSGPVTVSTAGSSFDTTLGVFRGSRVNALTRVAVNDDANYARNVLTSRLTFHAVAGQSYEIAVDGFDGAAGSVRLSLEAAAARQHAVPRPSNLIDLFAELSLRGFE